MKYGLLRTVQVCNITTGESGTHLVGAGDYTRSQMWCKENVPEIGEDLENLAGTYAWAWHGLKRQGLCERYGLPEELTFDSLLGMADEVTVYLDAVEGDLPLAGTPQAPAR